MGDCCCTWTVVGSSLPWDISPGYCWNLQNIGSCLGRQSGTPAPPCWWSARSPWLLCLRRKHQPSVEESLMPAPEVSQETLLLLEQILQLLSPLLPSSSVLDYLSSLILLYKWPSSFGGDSTSSRTLFHRLPAPARWVLCHGILGDSDDFIFSPCFLGPNAFPAFVSEGFTLPSRPLNSAHIFVNSLH